MKSHSNEQNNDRLIINKLLNLLTDHNCMSIYSCVRFITSQDSCISETLRKLLVSIHHYFALHFV